MNSLLEDLLWLGHSSLLIDGPQKIYIDPFNMDEDLPKADLILITHAHFDHCSPTDVAKIARPETIIVGPPDCVSKFKYNQIPMAPDQTEKVSGVTVHALAAYSPDSPYHPKEKGWLGYLVEVNGRRIYHAGDTCLHEAMAGLITDVAFFPIDSVYNMNAAQGIAALEAMGPKFPLVVPIHFGSVCGLRSEAGRFVRACLERGYAAEFLLPRSKERELPAVAPRLLEV